MAATPRTPATRADYAAIARSKIRDPGEGEFRRWLVYGRYKVGKTTMASTAPNMLIIDPENGTKEVPTGKAMVWPTSQWSDYDQVFKALQTGELTNKNGEKFEWVCLDNMTRVANMALRYVMKMGEERDLDRIPGLVQKQDYGKAGELLKGLLWNLHTLPMNVLYTAGDRVDSGVAWGESEDEDAEEVEVKFVPDLPKGARASLNQIVDVIGRLYTVKVTGTNKAGKEVSGRQRRLWIAPSDKYDTGYRSQHRLPEYLKGPTVPKLEELISTGKVSNG